MTEAGTAADATSEPLVDLPTTRPVLGSERVFGGAIWSVDREHVDLESATAGAGRVHREVIRHPGAVGILVLDDAERVLLQRQYRHPVGHELWELPAGLLDLAGESPISAARRELAEEADLRATTWHVLLDWFNSPGGSDEAFRLFLARDVAEVPLGERHDRTGEEIDMPTMWVPLEEAHDAVLTGRLHSPNAVVGILAAVAARTRQWRDLRPADAPWPQHRNG